MTISSEILLQNVLLKNVNLVFGGFKKALLKYDVHILIVINYVCPFLLNTWTFFFKSKTFPVWWQAVGSYEVNPIYFMDKIPWFCSCLAAFFIHGVVQRYKVCGFIRLEIRRLWPCTVFWWKALLYFHFVPLYWNETFISKTRTTEHTRCFWVDSCGSKHLVNVEIMLKKPEGQQIFHHISGQMEWYCTNTNISANRPEFPNQ